MLSFFIHIHIVILCSAYPFWYIPIIMTLMQFCFFYFFNFFGVGRGRERERERERILSRLHALRGAPTGAQSHNLSRNQELGAYWLSHQGTPNSNVILISWFLCTHDFWQSVFRISKILGHFSIKALNVRMRKSFLNKFSKTYLLFLLLWKWCPANCQC